MDEALTRAEAPRGPWSTQAATLLALLPLIVGVALGVAADRKIAIGPLEPNQVIYWVIVPLALLYPTIAAIARRMAYAPITVLVVAAMAPSLVYATRILNDELSRTAISGSAVTVARIAAVALPPAILAAGTFVAIELVSTASRRGVAVGVFGAIGGAAVFAASFLMPFIGFNLGTI